MKSGVEDKAGTKDMKGGKQAGATKPKR